MNFNAQNWNENKSQDISVRFIANVLYDNETQAYRFTLLLMEARKKSGLRLTDLPNEIPLSTWQRYAQDATNFGLLLEDRGFYYPTNKLSDSLRNFADYIEKWEKERKTENPEELYPNAKKGKEKPRRVKQE